MFGSSYLDLEHYVHLLVSDLFDYPHLLQVPPPHPATVQYSEHSVYIPAAATSAQHTEVEHLRAQEDVFSEVHDHEDLGATLSCPL